LKEAGKNLIHALKDITEDENEFTKELTYKLKIVIYTGRDNETKEYLQSQIIDKDTESMNNTIFNRFGIEFVDDPKRLAEIIQANLTDALQTKISQFKTSYGSTMKLARKAPD